MNDKKHSFVSNSTDLFSNLFAANLSTPSSVNAYMQSMHRTHFENEALLFLFLMTTQPYKFESSDQPQMQQQHSPESTYHISDIVIYVELVPFTETKILSYH